MERRVAALEDRIEARVRARMEKEIDAVLDLLGQRLSREEFAKVARIICEAAGEEEGRRWGS